MDHRQALAYLDAHVNLEARAGKVEGLSLDVMRALMAVLGDPQHAYPAIHVTGTNGKGSVARAASALLQAHGLGVGTYTSPHLERVNERLARDLEPIADDELAALVGELAPLVELAGVEPSYFELLTAAALSWFAEVAVDVAVVEVGMLGRYDATNVVDAAVAVVTNVGPDHTDRAEGWRRAVAGEKAGIVKPGSVLVLGETDPDLRPLFEAGGAAAVLVRDEDFGTDDERRAVGGWAFDLRTPAATYDELFVPLHGRHQVDNVALAVVAVEAFFGRALDDELVREALAGVDAPGRLEVLARGPLVVVDGAHNLDGAAALAEAVAEGFDVPGRRILVLGFLDGPGRDVAELLEALDVGRADLVVACAPDSPRAVPAARVAAAARAAGVDAEAVDDPAAAVARALGQAGEGDVVVVAGSLYLVAPARRAVAAALAG